MRDVSLVVDRRLGESTGGMDSVSQQKVAAEMSLHSFAAMPAIEKSRVLDKVKHFAPAGNRLQPSVATGEEVACVKYIDP